MKNRKFNFSPLTTEVSKVQVKEEKTTTRTKKFSVIETTETQQEKIQSEMQGICCV